MTSALEGGEWSAARPGRTLPPGKTRYPLYRRLGGPQGRSGQCGISRLTGILSPDHPARSQSLYRLRYPVHNQYIYIYIYIYIYTHTHTDIYIYITYVTLLNRTRSDQHTLRHKKLGMVDDDDDDDDLVLFSYLIPHYTAASHRMHPSQYYIQNVHPKVIEIHFFSVIFSSLPFPSFYYLILYSPLSLLFSLLHFFHILFSSLLKTACHNITSTWKIMYFCSILDLSIFLIAG
jgi:hypothetical protein